MKAKSEKILNILSINYSNNEMGGKHIASSNKIKNSDNHCRQANLYLQITNQRGVKCL
jgi:hypothetical protein